MDVCLCDAEVYTLVGQVRAFSGGSDVLFLTDEGDAIRLE